MIDFNTPDKTRLPDVRVNAQGNMLPVQLVTKKNMLFITNSMGLKVRFDVTSAQTVYTLPDEDISGDVLQEHVELEVLDMATRLGMKGDAKIREILRALARNDQYHPMEEWLKGLQWDGVDRIDTLIDTITTENSLWPVYLENWLIQTVEGVCGWRDRAEKKQLGNVLVLVGGQGIGKSHWFKKLGGAWLKGEAELHLSTSSGKDHQIAALRFPMVELSELNGTFKKADIETLKSFLTREEDEIRAPYERRALVRPRMTTFCGSVNDAEFLNDSTGSRRFWPVQVSAIDWSVEVDLAQLWAQAYEFWQQDSGFDLTAEENALRAVTAIESHTLISTEEEDIREFYRRHHGHARFPDAAMNRSEVLKMLYGNRSFGNKQISDIGKVLTDIGGKHKTIDGKQRAWMFPYNEFATDRASWPDKNHLGIVK